VSDSAPAADPASDPAALAARRSFRIALAALLFGAFCTSLSAIFIKLSELPPTATGFYRVALSAPLLFLWLRWERPRRVTYRAPRDWRDRRDLALAGVFFSINTAFWCWAMRYTSAANGLLISNLTPLFVAIGAFFFMRERFSRAFLLGMGLTVLGAAALVAESVSFGGAHVLGDGLAVGSCLFWTGYLLLLQRLRSRFTTATIMTWTAGVASLLLLVGAELAGEPLLPHTVGGWAAVLSLAFISQVAGQGLIAFSMAQLPASFTAIGLLVQPIYGMLVAWPIVGEVPTPIQILGGAVILFGIGLARRDRNRGVVQAAARLTRSSRLPKS
jgi:drug/metabolite transporter (DMT)-like permease